MSRKSEEVFNLMEELKKQIVEDLPPEKIIYRPVRNYHQHSLDLDGTIMAKKIINAKWGYELSLINGNKLLFQYSKAILRHHKINYV